MNEIKWLRYTEAQRKYGLYANAIANYVSSKKIESKKENGYRFINEQSLIDYLARKGKRKPRESLKTQTANIQKKKYTASKVVSMEVTDVLGSHLKSRGAPCIPFFMLTTEQFTELTNRMVSND